MPIDVRVINLYKLHIPKTKSFESLVGNIQKTSNKCYFTMGHYDLIDIQKIDIQNQSDLLSEAYDAAAGDENIEIDSFSSQKVLVFADKNKNQPEEKFQMFWDNVTDKHMLMMSMFHIDDLTDKGTIDLQSIVNEITDYFAKKELEILYYFTFDYSDIIIFCKTDDVARYVNTLNCLIYKDIYSTKKKKVIIDSFTFYGICRTHMLECLKQFAISNNDTVSSNENTFFAKINIGVQSYSTLKAFIQEVDKCPYSNKQFKINQIGRNDFAIVNTTATLDWLLYMEYLIDKYTTVDGTLIKNQSEVFSTFEAFIGAGTSEEIIEMNDKDTSSFESIPLTELNKECEILYNLLNDKPHLKTFSKPIRETMNSLASILKNGFAEDFVTCMYESFYHFIKYMSNKLCDKTEDEEKFVNTFNAYFTGLISLVNSGMHADRSFIQATAFNAVFYDIPPKLMAFYTALVYKMLDIMCGSNENRYDFLFTPDFSEKITVNQVSFPTPPPDDRILLVSINEQFFYSPTDVITTMGHEIAHFAGDEMRSRTERLTLYVKCMVSYIFIELIPQKLDKKYFDLIGDVTDVIIGQLNKVNELKRYLSTYYYYELAIAIIKYLKHNQTIHSYISKYAENMPYEEYCLSMRNCSAHTLDKFLVELENISMDFANKNNLYRMYESVTSALSEAYADLQMILLCGIDYKYYISKILHELADDNNLIKEDRHNFRTVCIIRLMIDLGVWSIDFSSDRESKAVNNHLSAKTNELAAFNDCFDIQKESLECRKKYQKVLNPISALGCTQERKNGIQDTNIKADVIYYHAIYCYLLNAAKKILETYNKQDKLELVEHLRVIFQSIKEFKSIEEIYGIIREETEKYKKKLRKDYGVETVK